MSFNQQGQIAFPNLDNYTWQAEDFELFQTYRQSSIAEILADTRTVGILWGGQITVVAGLEIQIAAGAALFSNGQLVTWQNQNVTLATANGVNPRIDRIELAYSLVNNTQVTNNANAEVYLDQLFAANGFDNVGTPAGSPVAPTLTVGNISIGLVSVAANQVTLLSGNISQIEDVAFNPSAVALGDSLRLVRNNRTLGCIQFSNDGGTTWNSLGGAGTLPQIVTAAMSPYTVTAAAPNLEVNTSGGPVIILAPALAGKPFPISVAKSTGDANTVSFTPAGTDPVNGDVGADVISEPYANKSYKPLSATWVF